MVFQNRPKLAVWKFASCDGCQLSLLDCEDELLAVAGAVEIAYFPEATRAVTPGPYDVSLVEGSITTPHDAERIRDIRKQSTTLVTIGAVRRPAASRRSAITPTSRSSHASCTPRRNSSAR